MASGEFCIRNIVRIVALQSLPSSSAFSVAQDGVCLLVCKQVPIFFNGQLLHSFSFSGLLCLGYAFLFEVSLVREAVWAQGVVEFDDKVMRRETEHFTFVVRLPTREDSGK